MGYHADFVTGQYIVPGDKVVAFLLEEAPGAGYPGSTTLFPSYEYKVASLPIFGRFKEFGGIRAENNSVGAKYTLACHNLSPERHHAAKEGEFPLPKTMGKLVDASPPLAFLLPETFQMLLNLATAHKAYDPLPVVMAAYQKLRELLATPKGQEFLKLKEKLKDDEEAYWLASIRDEKKAANSAVGVRVNSAKNSFGVSDYERFTEIAAACQSLNASILQTDPFTGERFELPAPLYIFSNNYSGRCASNVLGLAFESASEKEPILEGLLQIQLVDFGLMLLGRLWEPSLYKGDEQYSDPSAALGAHLCAATLPAVQRDARLVAKELDKQDGRVHEHTHDELNRLRALLPNLKKAAAEVQATIEAIEKLG